MKYFIWFLGVMSAICVFILILFSAIEIPAFNQNFYKKEYKKYNIAQEIKVNETDLMLVTNKLLDYLKDDTDNLDVFVTVDSKSREFFNQKEKDHMADVKVLFSKAYNIRKAILVVFVIIITTIFVSIKKPLHFISKYFLTVLTIILTICGIVGIIITTDFSKYFTIFHEIFFTNDLWLLDPNTDLLINIVPLPFFMDIAVFIGVLFITINIFVISICAIYLHKEKKA